MTRYFGELGGKFAKSLIVRHTQELSRKGILGDSTQDMLKSDRIPSHFRTRFCVLMIGVIA